MMEFTPAQASALKEFLGDVLQKHSPEEVILVARCLDKPAKTGNDGMLGFGIGHEIVLLLPPLLLVLKEFAQSSATEIAKHWGKELADWISSDDGKAIDPSAFSKLNEMIKARLEKQGMSSIQASSISDSVVVAMIGKPSLVKKLVKN